MFVVVAVALAIAGGGAQDISVSERPSLPTEAEAQEIADDSARDLKDSRFYNKVGATRADYDAAWQDCRLIARGTKTPAGVAVTTYNPAVISPAVAGLASGVGGLIGGAIIEGQMRRANRQSCLLIRGWRLITVSEPERARIAAFSDAERDAYFATIVGAANPPGEIAEWDNGFAAPQLAPEAEQ